LAGFVALQNGHGAAGEGEGVGEKFAERVVGAAFERRGEPADDGAARSVGYGFDRERAGGERRGHGTSARDRTELILSQRFGECGDDVLDGFATDAEAEEIGIEFARG